MNEMNNNGQDQPATQLEAGQFSTGVALLSKALKTAFIVSAFCITCMILYFLLAGGSFRVDTTKESVIVLRFGQLAGHYTEGWHWFLPYPVTKTIRIPSGIQSITSRTFMPSNTDRIYGTVKPNQPPGQETLAPGKDGYLLLGDNSIIHAEWKMSYRISDPKTFYLNCISQETSMNSRDFAADATATQLKSLVGVTSILGDLLDNAVIVTSAGLDIKSTYLDKTAYENKVKTALEAAIVERNLGVSLENLSLTLISPPIQTIEAFQMLQLASVTAAKVKEEANTYAIGQKNSANSEAAIITANAEAYKKSIVTEVAADADYFKQILEEYRKDQASTIVSLYSRTLADAMVNVQDKFIISTLPGGKQEIRLKFNPEPVVKKPAVAKEGESK